MTGGIYRAMSATVGLAFVVVGLIFGYEHGYSEWALGGVLLGVGVILGVGSFLVPERHLTAFLALCVVLNVLVAAYALFFPKTAH